MPKMTIHKKTKNISVSHQTKSPTHSAKDNPTLAGMVHLYQKKQYKDLAALIDHITLGLPDSADRLNICGAALYELQSYAEAEQCFRMAIKLKSSPRLENNLGNALRSQGQNVDAANHYRRAIDLDPSFAEAHNNLGNALKSQGLFVESMDCYDRAHSLNSRYFVPLYNKALVLQELKKVEEAKVIYKSILRQNPNMAQAQNNLAKILLDSGSPEKALKHLQIAARLIPDSAEVLNNLGNAFKELRRLPNAAKYYKKALHLNSDMISAITNLAAVSLALGQSHDAEGWFSTAINLDPDNVTALIGRAICFEVMRRFDEAIKDYRRALQIQPDLSETISKVLHLEAEQCLWKNQESDIKSIFNLEELGKTVLPFLLLPFQDDPDITKQRAERYAQAHHPSIHREASRPAKNKDILTIGYFSADFSEHVIGRLIARIIEQHSRSDFRIIAYDLKEQETQCNTDQVRNRIEKSADSFVTLRGLSDREAAFRARMDGVDIAVDLTGYTTGGRVGIFANRAAPLQVSYLGFPGTMGSQIYDYMIADKTVIPNHERMHYVENIVFMPGSYLVIDDSRKVATALSTREELGLPQNGFVFCCFNNSYKINPRMMDCWAQVLNGVPCSVLWLYAKNENVRENLRSEATKRGISADRIVFSGAHPYDKYLSNYQLADLFLDTFPYNANATANDALYAGIPVLTKKGRNLISRAAAGLLHTLGMTELAVDTPEEYVKLAIKIGNNPHLAKSLLRHIEEKRHSSLIFNSMQFTRALEQGYREMVKLGSAGLKPRDIYL